MAELNKKIISLELKKSIKNREIKSTGKNDTNITT
jgi:hypothetical protein